MTIDYHCLPSITIECYCETPLPPHCCPPLLPFALCMRARHMRTASRSCGCARPTPITSPRPPTLPLALCAHEYARTACRSCGGAHAFMPPPPPPLLPQHRPSDLSTALLRSILARRSLSYGGVGGNSSACPSACPIPDVCAWRFSRSSRSSRRASRCNTATASLPATLPVASRVVAREPLRNHRRVTAM